MRPWFFVMLCVGAIAGCGTAPTIVIEPLTVVSWEPNQGAQCVAATASLFEARVTFSDDLSSASLTAESLFVRPVGGEAVPGTLSYDKATQTVHLTVDQDLAWGTAHDLVAGGGLEGATQGRLGTPLNSTFTTISPGGCF